MRNNAGSVNGAVLYSTLYEKSEAMSRALKRHVLFLVLAIASVPIILAHWILVPSFLIASVVVPISIYKIREAYERAEGVCPTCGKTISVKLEAKDRLPLWRYCPDCDNSLQLLAIDAPDGDTADADASAAT